MLGDPLVELCDLLGRLPGVGERTAQRMAFYMLRHSPDYPHALASALEQVAIAIHACGLCQNLTASDPCPVCADSRRHRETICVVANPQDVNAIDATGEHRGLYHVLHGVLSPLDGVGPDDLRVKQLLARLPGAPVVQEVIVATPASVEGEATALYLAGLIKPLGIAVSRIAAGIPMGGEIEYADRLTLGRALGGRRLL
ncbi:MAG: recombination mediator RecR [Pseudomonadota bacterium]